MTDEKKRHDVHTYNPKCRYCVVQRKRDEKKRKPLKVKAWAVVDQDGVLEPILYSEDIATIAAGVFRGKVAIPVLITEIVGKGKK